MMENDGLAPKRSEKLESIQPLQSGLENKQIYRPHI